MSAAGYSTVAAGIYRASLGSQEYCVAAELFHGSVAAEASVFLTRGGQSVTPSTTSKIFNPASRPTQHYTLGLKQNLRVKISD